MVASFLVVGAPSSVSSCREWRLPSVAHSGPATTGAGCDGGTKGEGRPKRGREDGGERERWLWERKGIRDLDLG